MHESHSRDQLARDAGRALASYCPVYALGDEHLHRVADAAVLRRYEQLDGPRRANGQWPTLRSRLDCAATRVSAEHRRRRRGQRGDVVIDGRETCSHRVEAEMGGACIAPGSSPLDG